MVSRESEWCTYDGRWIAIKDMEDTHVANLLKHLDVYSRNHPYIKILLEESELRGLTKEFLDRADIPFKDPDGDWMLWDYKKLQPIKVG